MMLKRNMMMMTILVIYLNHLKSNSGGLIDRNNLLQGILVMST